MAEIERTLLDHYNLRNLYPTEWPSEKDEIDEYEIPALSTPKPVHKWSRLSHLERGPSLRSNRSVPGSQKGKDGIETVVQKDEQDPLGQVGSVVQALRQRGLPVDEDSKLRNRFLLSSTTFSPTLFLSEVHNEASTEDLLRGLDNLSRSIEQKSASLKVLVETNFERFVRAKATIDNVYTEMRNHGMEQDQSAKPHVRHTSRASNSLRKPSGRLSSGGGLRLQANEKRKNALVKESEYGVQGIKVPLIEATVKAEEIWGPALGGREKEDTLKLALSSLEKNRSILELVSDVDDCIRRRDYDRLGERYAKAQKHAIEAKGIAKRAMEDNVQLTDIQVHQIVITARVWMDIEDRIGDFKRDVWRRLTDNTAPGAGESDSDGYMDHITVLLRLGVQENPIWVWLLSRYDHLRNKISATFNRARVEIEIMRRRLKNGSKPGQRQLAMYLRTAADPHSKADLDNRQVIEFWEKIHASLTALLSINNGLLGEVSDFWDTAQSFIEGRRQRSLPVGIDGESRKHHRLSSENVRSLQTGILELFDLVREQVHNLFVGEPVADISSLYTPILSHPTTPHSAAPTSTMSSRFSFDLNEIPPPSPQLGEPWEKFAFWAPYSNCLSASSFLSKIMTVIATAASDIACVDVVKSDTRMAQQLRILIGDVRERCLTAVCAAWSSDSENCRELEDWTRSPENQDITSMPGYFRAFESNLLSNLQKIVYMSEATRSSDLVKVILAPPQRQVETIQKAFKNSLYKAFSGMMEHTSKPLGFEHEDDILMPALRDAIQSTRGTLIDASNINVRKLLTMSNFQVLRKDVLNDLVTQFQSNFSVTITEDSKTARDVLGQMNARIFQAYVRPTTESIREMIANGIASRTYAATNAPPTDARPYVYEVLLSLVLVHTEVSRTAPSMTGQILSYLLEQLSQALIDAFKKRPKYSLAALMQATLDVEFIAQTLSNYTTEKAGEIQGAIYLALDERTDNEARLRLQSELPQMRAILKRLREGTRGEFGCFKKARNISARERKT